MLTLANAGWLNFIFHAMYHCVASLVTINTLHFFFNLGKEVNINGR